MRVCIVTTRHKAADDRIFYKEALSLRKAYPDITLVAPAACDDTNFLNSGIRLVSIGKRNSVFGRLISVCEAVHRIRKEAPAICHIHDLDLILALPLLRALTKARLIYDSHESYPETMFDVAWLPRWLRRAVSGCVAMCERNLVRLCDLVITPVDVITNRFQRAGVKAVTVWNFPPMHAVASARTAEPEGRLQADLRGRLTGRFVLLYQGSMSEDRGLYHMIHAIDILRKRVPSALLLLVGFVPGRTKTYAAGLVQQLGLQNHVEMLDWVSHPEVSRLVRASDLGLIPFQPTPHLEIAIPIKLFEYMASGLPVLAADLPSFRHFVLDSGAGRLYDARSDEAFVEAIEQMFDDPDGWRRMAEAGPLAVNREWNWEVAEQVLLDSYRELAPNHL